MNLLKVYPIILASFFFSIVQLYSQAISNVCFTQDGGAVNIFYDLECAVLNSELYISTDKGSSFKGPLVGVKGDIGKKLVLPGKRKEIIWNIIQDAESINSDSAIFKVIVHVDSAKINLLPIMGGTHKMTNNGITQTYQIDNFYIGKYEITQKQWTNIMSENPSVFVCEYCPVSNVSPHDIGKFIEKLNQKTKLKYRLPTEAEWDYVANGGTSSYPNLYSGNNEIDEVAWYSGNAYFLIKVIGKKEPNELGAHDMTGNVSEVCIIDTANSLDSDVKSQIAKGVRYDYIQYVIRGGNISDGKKTCIINSRKDISLNNKKRFVGFRLAMDIDK